MNPAMRLAGPDVATEPRKLLVLFLAGLGNALMFTPALRLLREAWPGSRLVALTARAAEHDALELNRDLDEVRCLPFPRMGAAETWRAVRALRGEGFDLVFLPCPSNRIDCNVLAWLTGAPHRVGFRYLQQGRLNLDFLNTLVLSHRDYVHNAEHNLALVERITGRLRAKVGPGEPPVSLPTSEADRRAAETLLAAEGAMAGGWIGLHVSSARVRQVQRKCWPVKRFAELARALGRSRPGLGFLVFCEGDDAADSQRLLDMVGGRARLVEGRPVRVVAELMRRCRAVVANDSGLLHVAAAVGAPTVAIFGPTNPSRSGPWGGRATVVRRSIPCSPCFYPTSRDLVCPARLDFACVKELPVAEVLAAVEAWLR